MLNTIRRTAVRYLAQAGGLRPDVITRVPHSLQGPVTIGSGLVAVGLFAAWTWGYASYRLFLGDPFALWAAVGTGMLGGWLMFTVDRSLALSLDKRAAWWITATQVLSRLALAFALAWTMSTPAVLRFSRSIIATQLFAQQNRMTESQFSMNAALTGLNDERKTVADLKRELSDVRARLIRPPDTIEYTRAAEAVVKAERSYTGVVAANTARIRQARQQLVRLVAPRASSPADAEIRALERQIAGWSGEISSADKIRSAARTREASVWQQWQQDVSAQRDTLVAVLQKAEARAEAAGAEATSRNKSSERVIEQLLEPNLAREFTAYRQIISDSSNPDAATLSLWATAFHAVFFLLECVPMVLKLTWPRGVIDDAIAAANEEDANRVIQRANTRMFADQAREDVWRELLTKAFDERKQAHLNTTPIDFDLARRELDAVCV